jgi:ABC-type dipeptide/oligopeptide/nickel transport system ATPase component
VSVRAPWVAHLGLTRTPFSKGIAATDLFARAAHAEAVARIGFCVAEAALGVVVGDVGCGKTVAVRAAVSALDRTRHQVIYIGNCAFGARTSARRPPTCVTTSPWSAAAIRSSPTTPSPGSIALPTACPAHSTTPTAALVAAAADGKALVDDVSAKRAAAELTRD